MTVQETSPARRPVNPTRQRTPMASVIGADLRPGDRVGSAEPWTVAELIDPTAGRCGASSVLAAAGGCLCYRAERVEDAPRRTAVDETGARRVVFDHLRYAVRAR